MYGRAAGLYPRTLELLDQYDLLHPLTQDGFVVRVPINYDKHGNIDNSRGPMRGVFETIQGNTFLEYMLSLRLKYSEVIIQREYERIGGVVLVGWELRELSTVEEASGKKVDEEHPVTVEIRSVASTETTSLAA
jgi:phenol 2-monooxygenase (NADPH)